MDECSQYILLARKGDMQAFAKLVNMHQEFAMHTAIRYVMDHESAQDVVQEAFIRVWKHLHRFRLEMKFSTWLYRIVINLCYDRLRRQQVNITIDDSLNEISNDDLEKDVENRDKLRFIKHIVQTLPAKQRMVFLMRDFDDLEIAEIAKLLNMRNGTVKSNLYYARKNIRERLTAIGIHDEA